MSTRIVQANANRNHQASIVNLNCTMILPIRSRCKMKEQAIRLIEVTLTFSLPVELTTAFNIYVFLFLNYYINHITFIYHIHLRILNSITSVDN